MLLKLSDNVLSLGLVADDSRPKPNKNRLIIKFKINMDKNKTIPTLSQTAVSGSVFFETGKYYHKIWVNGNDHRYFKCDRIVNPNHVHKDAFGTGLYISPGTSCAQIYLSDYQCKFEGWEEISKEEFILKTKDYVSRAVNELC